MEVACQRSIFVGLIDTAVANGDSGKSVGVDVVRS